MDEIIKDEVKLTDMVLRTFWISKKEWKRFGKVCKNKSITKSRAIRAFIKHCIKEVE